MLPNVASHTCNLLITSRKRIQATEAGASKFVVDVSLKLIFFVIFFLEKYIVWSDISCELSSTVVENTHEMSSHIFCEK